MADRQQVPSFAKTVEFRVTASVSESTWKQLRNFQSVVRALDIS